MQPKIYQQHILSTILILGMSATVFAAPELLPQQLERVKAAQELLCEADPQPLQKIINELQTSPALEGNIYILESVALTYRDLVAKYGIINQSAKERLLEKVRLNMAYFQLGGQDNEGNDQNPLDIMIRRKLKEYLPEYVWKDTQLFHSLE